VLRRSYSDDRHVPEGSAVEIDHIRKEYSTKLLGIFGRKKPVVAIEDLSFSIPKGEIFCLASRFYVTIWVKAYCQLGRNGAAKSTTLSAIAQLLSITSGRIRYAEDLHIGIASQKDVLWDELTCLQVRVRRDWLYSANSSMSNCGERSRTPRRIDRKRRTWTFWHDAILLPKCLSCRKTCPADRSGNCSSHAP